jgi:hypothetical protein
MYLINPYDSNQTRVVNGLFVLSLLLQQRSYVPSHVPLLVLQCRTCPKVNGSVGQS